MSMIDVMNDDIKTAMKAGEKEKLNALRYLKSILLENKTSKAPIEELDVIIKYHKKLKDSLVNFPDDSPLRAQTEGELKIIEVYLPKALSEAEVSALIANIVAANPGSNMGAVMKELTPQIKGRFDGKKASDMVRAATSGA
jgi:uncharacterized protein YqeY